MTYNPPNFPTFAKVKKSEEWFHLFAAGEIVKIKKSYKPLFDNLVEEYVQVYISETRPYKEQYLRLEDLIPVDIPKVEPPEAYKNLFIS